MRAHILRSSASGEPTRLRTALGELAGSWEGRDPVEAGMDVNVELTAPRPYRWNEIRPIDGPTGFSVTAEDHVAVLGEVVEVDENDVLTLGVGETLLLIETEGDPPLGVTGTRVRLVVDDLQIYPTNM